MAMTADEQALIAELDLFGGWSQRWTRHVPTWRRASEGGFDQRRYTVRPVDFVTARDFVVTHHYSRSFPAASRLIYGMFHGRALVGVVVFGVPVRAEVLTGPLPTLVPYKESLELSRLILLDEVPSNAESWFVGRVFKAAAGAGLRGVVSFSDPMPRRTAAGRVLTPGHVGHVYKALNGVYTGRGTPRTLWIMADGRVFSARRRAKITGGERGDAGAIRELVELGAEPPRTGEPLAGWLTAALPAVGARRVRHHGNHRFVWTLGDRGARRRTPIGLDPMPYPTTIDPIGA